MSTFQKFIQYYKPYKKVFIFDLICAAFISLVDLAYPQILRSLTKTLFLKDASMILKTLPIIGGILFICYIFQAFCKYYVSCQGHIMGAKMERDMRQELFEHYEELSFSYYSQNNSGQMMSKLVSDLFDISEMAHHGPENLFISLIKIIGSFSCSSSSCANPDRRAAIRGSAFLPRPDLSRTGRWTNRTGEACA